MSNCSRDPLTQIYRFVKLANHIEHLDRFPSSAWVGAPATAGSRAVQNGFSLLLSILIAVLGANRNQSRQKVEAHRTIVKIEGISDCQKESKAAKSAFLI